MNKNLAFLLLSIMLFASFSKQIENGEFPYKNSSLAVNDRVNDLLGRMTTEEKINQMDMYWGKEVANMKRHDAASYSEEKVLAVLGKTSMILAPVLDLARDPRWGRVEETYGEDPYLAALNGVAIVKGMQGNSLAQPDAVIAEPKHFAVHSVPEAGSNIGPVFVGEREARSNFLFTFEKAVREGGAKGIMAAYHELDGIPCVSNKWLLTDVLRKEWGFTGFVLSDLGAIRMTVNSHMTAKDTTDALSQTIKAGMNMQFYDFSHKGFKAAINEALTNKTLSEEELNGAVRDILRVKFMLGLFENPYVDTLLISKVFHSVENHMLKKILHKSGSITSSRLEPCAISVTLS